ncbi:hypothetical protein AGR7C_pAt0027 [Agrobacterium deltaense Zutra 3/1]|uniref:Uncharacterized protein n=1 Tax=Agrobacterium deltaense Zutra 3/1 TaxID=1183427 RepID=A0A1S7S2X6_9HYPH|nr:hypothetical protein AGR7C_pAt0027 [Agrobacterium deltaense Zutra 3/1]
MGMSAGEFSMTVSLARVDSYRKSIICTQRYRKR